ncbi:divalent metal cation transporter [Parapedobacter tibetensis]|uniref:divalent metal cation transporter n=1 Tax=Parapedobacter tibetensis TaxID=2972951 RepID=UPI00214DD24A|nr:divalent metal cation transporter [Parapedobacter tibetensis]
MATRLAASLWKNMRALAPGIVTAAIVFGPSKITITSKIGADYGYSLLWIVVVAIFFMMVFTAMGARIGNFYKGLHDRGCENYRVTGRQTVSIICLNQAD